MAPRPRCCGTRSIAGPARRSSGTGSRRCRRRARGARRRPSRRPSGARRRVGGGQLRQSSARALRARSPRSPAGRRTRRVRASAPTWRRTLDQASGRCKRPRCSDFSDTVACCWCVRGAARNGSPTGRATAGGGASRTRTGDLLGAIQALSQLSYSPARTTKCRGGAGTAGPPPPLPRVACRETVVSFRTRLTALFVGIVLVTMAGFGLLAFRLVDGLDANRADAQARAYAKTVRQRYEAARLAAAPAARRVVRDPALQEAPRRGDVARIRDRARALVRRERLQRLTVVSRGQALADVGDPGAIAPARQGLRFEGG